MVGLYFAYDSYVKLALGQTTAYANQAFQYQSQDGVRTSLVLTPRG